MHYAKSLAFVGLIAAATPTATFSPAASARRDSHRLGATRDDTNDGGALRNLVATSALTFGLLFPADALAARDVVPQPPLNDAFASSSLQVSATITTMDFSMPSSYDSIADPVASGKDELTQESVVNVGSPRLKKKSASSAKKTSSAGPSVSRKEASEAAKAERVAQRKAQEAEQKARDEEAAKERDARIKAAREEKIAKRKEAAEEEAAAAAEKEEAKFKGATFVDTSIPTY